MTQPRHAYTYVVPQTTLVIIRLSYHEIVTMLAGCTLNHHNISFAQEIGVPFSQTSDDNANHFKLATYAEHKNC